MRQFLKALAFTLLLLSLPAHGMNRLVEILATGVTNDVGAPLAAGTATFYDAGTSSLRTVYTDFTLSTPASNPLTLDSAGRAVVYTDRRIKVLLKTSAGATVRTIDNVGTADSDVAAAAADASAGDGLTAPGDGTIAVNPDGESTEVYADKVQVKPGGISQGSSEILNASCAASVASNALTISLKNKGGSDPSSTSYVTAPFRSATLTSGVYTTVQGTTALSQVVASGSTLGHVSAVEWPIYVYLLNSAGSLKMAYSSSPVDERYLQTTVDEAGNGDLSTALYSDEVYASVPVKLLCVMKSTQTTAGTWAAVPTAISAATSSNAFSQIYSRATGTTVPVGGYAKSSANTSQVVSSTSFTDLTNLSVTITTTGRPVMVGIMSSAVANSYVEIDRTNSNARAYLKFLRDSTDIGFYTYATSATGSTAVLHDWPASYFVIDAPSAGTYTYKAQARVHNGTNSETLTFGNVVLVAYEL